MFAVVTLSLDSTHSIAKPGERNLEEQEKQNKRYSDSDEKKQEEQKEQRLRTIAKV